MTAATPGQADEAAFWAWMDAYADEPHNASYEVPDMQRAYEAGRAGGPWTETELAAALDGFCAYARSQGQLLEVDANEFARVLHAELESARAHREKGSPTS